MGLFEELPPCKRPSEGPADPQSEQRAKAARLEPSAAPPAPSAADLEDLASDGEEAPAQEPAEQQQLPSAAAEADDVPPPPPDGAPPAAPGDDDQVAAALRKIASHIGHAKKFGKASQLLRELLAQGAVGARHGPLLFSALKAAMADPARAADPLLAREYSKLFTAASKAAEVFSVREKNQLEVFGVWAVLRGQLATDDSFLFNKVVARLKDMAAELPEAADEEEAAAAAAVAAAAAAPDPVLAAYDARRAEAAGAGGQRGAADAAPPPAPPAPGEEADTEADPFGLDALMERQEAAEAAAAAAAAAAARHPKSLTWTAAELLCQRRAALLDCLDAAKASYRHMWARTSVDLLIEHCHRLRDRFLPSQRPRLDELMQFVRDQRRIRKLGPSAKEVNRDSTSFERARAEWSRADVSHRGKVGAGGDRGAEQWLG